MTIPPILISPTRFLLGYFPQIACDKSFQGPPVRKNYVFFSYESFSRENPPVILSSEGLKLSLKHSQVTCSFNPPPPPMYLSPQRIFWLPPWDMGLPPFMLICLAGMEALIKEIAPLRLPSLLLPSLFLPGPLFFIFRSARFPLFAAMTPSFLSHLIVFGLSSQDLPSPSVGTSSLFAFSHERFSPGTVFI